MYLLLLNVAMSSDDIMVSHMPMELTKGFMEWLIKHQDYFNKILKEDLV